MQQYKPIRSRYWLMHFLSGLIGFILAYFALLPLKLTWAESLPRVAFYMVVLIFIVALLYKHYAIEVKDGQLIGPSLKYKRISFPTAEVDWSKSVPIRGWRRWIKNEYVVSSTGQKIIVHPSYSVEQRESLRQALKQPK